MRTLSLGSPLGDTKPFNVGFEGGYTLVKAGGGSLRLVFFCIGCWGFFRPGSNSCRSDPLPGGVVLNAVGDVRTLGKSMLFCFASSM